jgi:hypothetical protein
MRLGAARFAETLFVEKNESRAQQHGTRCTVTFKNGTRFTMQTIGGSIVLV